MIDGEHFAIEYYLLVTCSAVGPVTRRRKMFSYSHLTVHEPARDHDLHTSYGLENHSHIYTRGTVF